MLGAVGGQREAGEPVTLSAGLVGWARALCTLRSVYTLWVAADLLGPGLPC